MILDATLLNIQNHMVRIKKLSEANQGMDCFSPLHLGVVAIEKGAFGSPSTKVANFTYCQIPLGKEMNHFMPQMLVRHF